MARKLKKPNHADKLSAQSTEDQKDFLDPATTAVVGAVGWFAVKAAAQAIIGWIAVQFFVPVWNWCTKRRKDNDDQGDSQEVPTEEQGTQP